MRHPAAPALTKRGLSERREIDRRSDAVAQQDFAELNERFDAGFDPARSLYADACVFARPSGAFVIARVRGRRVGCGAVKFKGKQPAEFKRMWIAKECGGLGLGKRLLDRAVRPSLV
jgi:GNAT superfamily N-acetyltransferase